MTKPKMVFKITSRPTFRDLRGRFVRADKQILEDFRKGMRREGQRMVRLAQEEAPKRKGRFAKSIRYRSFSNAGNGVGFSVTTAQPLGKWILEGTKPHLIRAKNKRALKFLWEKGPRSSSNFTGFHFYRHVRHPGTKPNKFIGRAYRRWLPGARAFLGRVSTRYIRTIAGGSPVSLGVG